MRSTRRIGSTLIELMVSLTTASILLVGLSSAMFIALRATDPSSSPAPATISGLDQLTSLFMELHDCVGITEESATAITFTVADRDADSNPETIRYAWSGTASDPLTRQYNGGNAAIVVADVHDFAIEYYDPGTSVERVTFRIQVTNDSQTSVQTTIPVLNRP